MERKDTDSLRLELMDSPDLDEFLTENSDSFMDGSVSDYLIQLINEKKISKSTLAKQSGISEVYLHQIIAGKRKPSRNRVLCICYGLGATVEVTQTLLKLCGFAQLYSANRRDAIILYGLMHGMELYPINDKLFIEDEETLF